MSEKLLGPFGAELLAWIVQYPAETLSFAFFVGTLVWAIANWDGRSADPGSDLDIGLDLGLGDD